MSLDTLFLSLNVIHKSHITCLLKLRTGILILTCSLDRYVAVTRPVTYPSIMSSKKAKMLIGAVWVLSFLICFPPLVGWNDRKRKLFKHLIQPANTTTSSSLILGTNGSIMDLSYEQQQIYQQHGQQFSSEAPKELYREEECFPTCELTNDKVIHHFQFNDDDNRNKIVRNP